ncbi:MAG: phage tail protein [Lachnospiraceae bacterium]
MQRTVKGRWASHSLIGKKPKKQFLGADLEQLTFTITLNAEHGIKPRKTIEKIEKLIYSGKPQTVVIGKKKIGSNKYVITEMSESWDTILNRGEVVKITCDITLEEYL